MPQVVEGDGLLYTGFRLQLNPMVIDNVAMHGDQHITVDLIDQLLDVGRDPVRPVPGIILCFRFRNDFGTDINHDLIDGQEIPVF